MVEYAKVRVAALVFNPISDEEAAALSQNTMYADALTNIINGTSTINAGSATSLFVKQMQAGAAPMTANTPVAKRQSDGKIIPLDRDNPTAQKPIGVLLGNVTNIDDLVNVFLSGPNLAGIVTDKGFAPGDEIYSANIPGGMVNDISAINVNTDAVIRLGIADCGPGAATATATDLILSMEIISFPSGG